MLDGLQRGLAPSPLPLCAMACAWSVSQLVLVSPTLTSTGAESLGHLVQEDWESYYLFAKCFQQSALLIFVDIFHLAPYYASAHIIRLLFLTVFEGIISFFLYQSFQLLLFCPVCCTVSSSLNLFYFLPFLRQSDFLLLYITQKSHSRSSQYFWIFL